MTPLIIIPARGGSKGIPRKNIVALAGRPLIAYTIDVARAIADNDHIILSSDDDTIIDTARSLGLPVDYRRPDVLATDTAGSQGVIIDAMDYADSRSIAYDCVILLQPTSPLRSVDDVKATLKAYSPDIDMAVTVVEASANPYYNCYETSAEGYLHIAKGDGMLTRRQDAPKAYEINGAVYVINPASLRSMPMGAFTRRRPVVMDAIRSIDIDTPLDLLIAETILRQNLQALSDVK